MYTQHIDFTCPLSDTFVPLITNVEKVLDIKYVVLYIGRKQGDEMHRLKFDPAELLKAIGRANMTEVQFKLALIEHCAAAGKIMYPNYYTDWLAGKRHPQDYLSYIVEVLRSKGLDDLKMKDLLTEVPVKEE